MAKEIKPVGPSEQNMFSKGTVTDSHGDGVGATKVSPSDGKQADAAFAQSKDYPGDRSPTPPTEETGAGTPSAP